MVNYSPQATTSYSFPTEAAMTAWTGTSTTSNYGYTATNNTSTMSQTDWEDQYGETIGTGKPGDTYKLYSTDSTSAPLNMWEIYDKYYKDKVYTPYYPDFTTTNIPVPMIQPLSPKEESPKKQEKPISPAPKKNKPTKKDMFELLDLE